MPRYARMLAKGMQQRGHTVELWSPQPFFFKTPSPAAAKKWLSYIDQYVLFPRHARRRLRACSPDTLFVFTDHALGPWVPLVANRPHVIHSHDFLAQRSAAGEITEQKTRWTGRQYQAFIRRGYVNAKHFIAVSKKTKEDLYRFTTSDVKANVVYNGLNQSFRPADSIAARKVLGQKNGLDLTAGYLLHVGGNAWYKNRSGVINIYNAWRSISTHPLPLLLLGEDPSPNMKEAYNESPYKKEIHFITGADDDDLRTAYNGARVFLFPSLAEGFGWPIAEAMASGCPVITTNEAPMTEVAGEAAFLIPRQPFGLPNDWAIQCATTVEHVVSLSPDEYNMAVTAGKKNAARFDPEKTLNAIETIYLNILKDYATA